MKLRPNLFVSIIFIFSIIIALLIPQHSIAQVDIDPRLITYQYVFSPNFGRGDNFSTEEGWKASTVCADVGVTREDLNEKTMVIFRKFTEDKGWVYGNLTLGAKTNETTRSDFREGFNSFDKDKIAKFCKEVKL